ncbi:hypothetical protein C8A00DRAFT_35417 [Chaetomidium leptoderma]|uniref:Proteophosphoglycan ppg4 n=1 Tax=Chaetomidium leptoderma TaxID=669021 RepID=A0AAN6ZUZ1_9PEZI|nr:hypothetical protein C8A00DRAFT_35417 [Chaetomidium leptoderma]
MGNAQSTEAPRRTSQRLSKPKTGNHATAGLLSSGSFSNSARHFSNAPLPNPPPPSSRVASTASSVVEASGGLDRRLDSLTSLQSAPAAQRESKRRSLFRSRSSRRADSAPQNHGGGPGSRMVDRMTRASSMTYESAVAYYGQTGSENRLSQPESRTSWNYNLTSYEAKRLLNLAEEPQLEHAAAMSENMMTAVTETTWKSSNPSHPPSAPITRANSDVSLYMPVRRRSIIQTPGVATRSRSTRDPPPLPQLNFRHSHPPTPSLSRQHSVESYRSGVMSMPPRMPDSDCMPRVATPCEDSYLSIGAFKLGSLRITNGAPRPVTPEIDMARGNEGLSTRHAITRDAYLQISETGITTSAAEQNAVLSPKSLPEITTSPTQRQPTSPGLQTTSKITALEDQLFDDEAQPEYSSIEILDVRLDPNAKPPHTQIERSTGASVTRTDSGFMSTASPASEVPLKPLAKADSGYSSNVSLRSFQAKAQVFENPPIAASTEKQLPNSTSHRGAPVGSERESVSNQPVKVLYPAVPERESRPPPVPPKDAARYSSVSQPRLNGVARERVSIYISAEENKTNTAGATRHSLSPIATVHSGNREPSSPGSEVRSPVSIRSSASDNSGSTRSTGGGARKVGRLQRFLSGTRRPNPTSPTVQATHALEQANIPPVPREVQYKLHERAGRFPTTAKRLAVRPRSSLDTLKTIFSVGSIEASLDAVNAMQNAPTASEPESKEGIWKHTLSVPASIANVAAHVIPRKPISRKPVPVRQESTTTRDQAASKGRENDVCDVASPVTANTPILSPKSRKRSMSLTFLRHRTSDLNLTHSTADLPSPALPSPVAKAMSAESDKRESRPVNSTRRRPLSLRVPPPLRSQSSMSSLNHKTSRESIRSYPAAHTLANKASMDSIYSYSSSQAGAGNGPANSKPPNGVSMDPRRLQSFRQYHSSQSSPYNSPNGDGPPDHALARQTSQTFAANGSRRNSISSVQSEGGFHPGSTQGWQVRTTQQLLRHRASYDGYSYQQRFPQSGHPPSMSNGYTAPAKAAYDPRRRRQLDAAATWSKSQADAAAGQWYQGGQQPPSIPRGHYRNRSMGNRSAHGLDPPYRVLHSYNSPAYRHAPIWG